MSLFCEEPRPLVNMCSVISVTKQEICFDIKDVLFWDMMPCVFRKENKYFGGIFSLYLQGNRTLGLPSSQRRYASRREHRTWGASSLRAGGIESLVTLKMEAITSSELSVLFLESHDVVSQKTTSSTVSAMKNYPKRHHSSIPHDIVTCFGNDISEVVFMQQPRWNSLVTGLLNHTAAVTHRLKKHNLWI
jgi:hypothetical protein